MTSRRIVNIDASQRQQMSTSSMATLIGAIKQFCRRRPTLPSLLPPPHAAIALAASPPRRRCHRRPTPPLLSLYQQQLHCTSGSRSCQKSKLLQETRCCCSAGLWCTVTHLHWWVTFYVPRRPARSPIAACTDPS
jgi:hypothetical protein